MKKFSCFVIATVALAAVAPLAAAVPFTPTAPNNTEPVLQPIVPVESGAISYHVAIDRKRGYLYAPVAAAPGQIVKARLATTTSPLTVVGKLILDPADSVAYDIHLDEDRGFGMILCLTAPGRIIKFALDDSPAPPTRLDTLDLQAGEDAFVFGDYDRANGILYATSAFINPAQVAKIATGTATTPMSRLSVATFDPADTNAAAIAIDHAAGKGWVFCPNRVVQFSLGAGPAPPTRETHTDLLLSAQFSAVFNPLTRQVVFGVLGNQYLGAVDVSGPAPVSQGLFLELLGFGRPALDAPSGLMFCGLTAGLEGFAKFSIAGNQTLPGRLPAPTAPLANFVSFATAYDPVRGFVYGSGADLAGMAFIPFRQAPDPGPDMNGYVNKLSAKSSATKSNVKAQLYIFNTGSAPGTNFLVRTFLSDDDRLSYDDLEIGKPRRVKKLDPGKVRKLGAGGAVSGPVAGKFLIGVIDGEKTAGDGNYGDNVIISRRL